VTGALVVLLPGLAGPMPGLACTIAVLWVMVLLNIIGPKMTARYGAATLAVGLLPIAGVAAFGWFWFDPQLFAHTWNVSGKPVLGAVQASLVSVFWAFTGVESATVAASVVRNPERNVPIAAIGGVALAGAIYILASAAMFGLLPASEMAVSTAPFASATGKVLGAAAAGLVALCALLKASGTLGGWILLTAETSRSSAVLGFFPRWLGRTRADGTPVPGLVLTGVLTTLGALLTVSPTLGKQFAMLINVATVLALVIYGYCALALLRFSKEMPTAGGRLLAAALGILGALFCAWLVVTSDLQLLWWSLGVLLLCVPAWIGFRIAERRKAPAATTS
jgi:arginine:agmatine antiporter